MVRSYNLVFTHPCQLSQKGEIIREPSVAVANSEQLQDELREFTVFWLRMAEGHRDISSSMMRDEEPCHTECLGRESPVGAGRAFKGLLAASNDTVRFRWDAALMWRHVENVRPVADREGTQAMENLLAATTGPDERGCSLTGFSETYRKGTPYPGMREGELEAVKRWIKPAIDALITED